MGWTWWKIAAPWVRFKRFAAAVIEPVSAVATKDRARATSMFRRGSVLTLEFII